ncbi:conserved hypothetical protein (plasmid) [Trichormus variabilis ATCC 29413]|uniref:Uncharacterized protein n=2 Tax=Anabaena variabilis TaxID=264691 RepID=Q3M202_TRIV2|nr:MULTISPECIES: hypothetical protein [Nostocaceae]ABA24984.1 conserved hypothetical protein [Trichormus variabilis ATCC 29413]MBD2383476.1 hypothetical protein [Trichormus variabilis FACHB-319]MBC1217792.1 hypothetical protein [Trichormus variabilis ARAD]MBC1259072.1 hypothetical protein [Trichormus variabilis V5]MBC1270731.1 hypothetical protein [Trichormus variabilis FSR]
MQLNRVYDSTLLSFSKVYQIQRTLYRYLYQTGTIKHPQYHFKPMPGQRKKTNLVINHKTLINRCEEVVGMQVNATVIDENATQMKLF